jgi:outer membrane protein
MKKFQLKNPSPSPRIRLLASRNLTIMKLMKFTTFVVSLLSLAAVAVGETASPPVKNATLGQLLEYALEHNISIRQAQEQILEQEGLIVEIKSSILPQASLMAGYSTKDEDLLVNRPAPGTGATDYWNVSIEVSQLLYSGGGVTAALDAQKYARESVRHALRAAVDRAVLEVRSRFYEALLTRGQIAVQEQNVQYLQEQLKTVKDRFAANTVSRFDVLQAEVQLANAQPALIRARNNYRIAIDELYRTVGYPSQVIHAYDGSEIEGELVFEPIAYNFADALQRAMVERPELQQLDTINRAREAGVRVARAGYFPTVSVYGGYDVEKSPLSDTFGDSLSGWKVGVRSSWALFDGRRTKGQVIQARSRLRQAELDAENLRLGIEVEVRRAVSALQEASELAEAASRVTEQATEALRLAEVRYSAGTATQLELLQSRVAVTDARTNQLFANYSYLLAAAQLRKAIGDSAP